MNDSLLSSLQQCLNLCTLLRIPSTKEKKAQRATETTPKDDAPAAEKSSPKKTTPQRAAKVMSTDSASRVKKTAPKKKQTPATATAQCAKPTRRTRASKRKKVRLPGPYVEPGPSETDTDTPNSDLITGDDDSRPDPTASRATKPSEGGLTAASTSASEPAPAEEAPVHSPGELSNARKAENFLNARGTQDPKGSASAATLAKAPQERLPTPEDGPDPVDYEALEPDQDREQGELPDPNESPQLTEQQRVTHPGSPMIPKTAAAVARAQALDPGESQRDVAPSNMSEQQIITNAGIDEGVPPELLQADNRIHLSDRAREEASQTVGTKREREAFTPRTREQLLALRYWTLDDYREHLRLSRRPGPGVSQCDKCPVVLWDDTGLTRRTNDREFEVWIRFMGYACPEFLASPYRIDWLAQRRLHFRMAKMITDDQWQTRFFDRHVPTPPAILCNGLVTVTLVGKQKLHK
ncbi:unnamed protein product [Phytophthora fragariaefolia]|uniref:Unnamed protein product n=1 Tax=Phytophthora fragariaefolia TaxID=1490495 RepID=A0A9W6TKS1_9STRA|nr:unnamed protein product [Phytophthora fragariaefolia]